MIRKARLDDIPKIHALVNSFATDELMLPLAIGEITERIRDFWVAHNDGGEILGTVALHPVWEKLVEVRSLAVSKDLQGGGWGKKLLDAALNEAIELGADEVFTLTYVPEFFRKNNFDDIDRADLPHKVWQDCTKCPKFPDCGEVAMIYKVS